MVDLIISEEGAGERSVSGVGCTAETLGLLWFDVV